MNVNSATINASYQKYPLAWWAGIVSVFLGAVLYLRMPLVTQTKDSLALIQADVETVRLNFREGSGMNEDLARMEELVQLFHKRLTDSDQRAKNVGYFDGFRNLHADVLENVRLSGINQIALVRENPSVADWNIWEMKQYGVLPFEMSVSGLLTDILKVLYFLKQSDVVLNVRSFELRTDSTREQGYMSMSLIINTVAKSSSMK